MHSIKEALSETNYNLLFTEQNLRSSGNVEIFEVLGNYNINNFISIEHVSNPKIYYWKNKWYKKKYPNESKIVSYFVGLTIFSPSFFFFFSLNWNV